MNFNAILCRTNAGVVEVAIREHEAGKIVAVIITGGLESLRKFAQAADDLMQGQRTDHSELVAFKDWAEVVAYVGTDEGVDLRPMVRLIEKYGTEAVFGVCANSLDEKRRHEADVQVCTAHKSKGLEFDRVLIHNDFQPPKDGGIVPPDTLRLLYVAVTRARLLLDASAIAWAINPQPVEIEVAA